MLATLRKPKTKKKNGHKFGIKPLRKEIVHRAEPRAARNGANGEGGSQRLDWIPDGKPGCFKPHPLSELLPLMNAEDEKALEDDIRHCGLVREPIVIYEGKILDGRNRYRVASRLGMVCKLRNFDPKTEGSALNFVYSHAVKRNMDQSQKAAAAVGFLEKFEAERPTDTKRVHGLTRGEWQKKLEKMSTKQVNELWHEKVYGDFCGSFHDMCDDIIYEFFGENRGQTSRDLAGGLFGVSGRYVQDARKLKELSPELFADVFAGRKKLKPAMSDYQREKRNRELQDMAEKAKKAPKPKMKMLHVGDCLEVVPKLEIRPSLIFTDPPYNLGLDYGLGKELDRRPEGEYVNWCKEWITMLGATLADDGSILIMIDNRHQAHFWWFMGHVANLHFRTTILWRENFGNYTAENFTPSFRFVHYFTKHKTRFTWNGNDVMIDSDRIAKYDDKRGNPAGKVPGNSWEFVDSAEPIAMDVPRLVGNAAERGPARFPTQLSLAGVERIVKACSNPGDLVLDPFNGSGTTGEAALRNGRKYVGVDLVPANVGWAEKRLAAVMAEIGGK